MQIQYNSWEHSSQARFAGMKVKLVAMARSNVLPSFKIVSMILLVKQIGSQGGGGIIKKVLPSSPFKIKMFMLCPG